MSIGFLDTLSLSPSPLYQDFLHQSPLRHLKTNICGMTIAVNGGAWRQYLLPHWKLLQNGLNVVLATPIIWFFTGVSEKEHAKPTSRSSKSMPSLAQLDSRIGCTTEASTSAPIRSQVAGLWALGRALFAWRFDAAVAAKLVLPSPAMPCLQAQKPIWSRWTLQR